MLEEASVVSQLFGGWQVFTIDLAPLSLGRHADADILSNPTNQLGSRGQVAEKRLVGVAAVHHAKQFLGQFRLIAVLPQRLHLGSSLGGQAVRGFGLAIGFSILLRGVRLGLFGWGRQFESYGNPRRS